MIFYIRISSILHFFQIILPFDFYLYLYLYFNRYLFCHREIQKYNIIIRDGKLLLKRGAKNAKNIENCEQILLLIFWADIGSKRILVKTLSWLYSRPGRVVIRDNKDNSAISVSRRSSNIFSQSFCRVEVVDETEIEDVIHRYRDREWLRIGREGAQKEGRKEGRKNKV